MKGGARWRFTTTASIKNYIGNDGIEYNSETKPKKGSRAYAIKLSEIKE